MDEVYKILLALFPIIMAITLHEAAHGWVAFKLGDSTARDLGRITANPIKHIDPIGTVLIPVVMILVTGFAFGYAKPVPVDVRKFEHPQKDMALVALAGPLSNFIMAVFWTFVLMLSYKFIPSGAVANAVKYMSGIGVIINIILMVVNLLPMLPLDGGRIVTGVLPFKWAVIFVRSERYGMWLVILLLVTGILGKILMPMVEMVQKNLFGLFGLG
ncbi:MAG: site-2 protease family protein [endosymbiont of Galathealinum brachiosum]|uniref:Site-2 protease family protein n=1 Tax=endosymbiont of Galathealinum brachiosum TaxID=2200906 RepID=A0A370DHR1_9GAMM|nr:MAG: site-2 protease family protein [endosymbiont of Galathealinum brachiosum]